MNGRKNEWKRKRKETKLLLPKKQPLPTNPSKELVARMKPPHIVKAENEPLSGNINTELVGYWKTPNSRERLIIEEYIFKTDGSGEFISVNQRSKEKTVEAFNWRVNGNCIVRQMICTSGNCPRGDRYILKCLPFALVTEQGKAALKLDYSYYYKNK